MSNEYEMKCGIHQGGYLSLVKYIAFINTLIECLEESNLCATIFGLNVSPVGYADDIASASTSKNKVDAVLKIVFDHSRKWRYDFNAKESAILVYGETAKEGNLNAKDRMYRLGPDRVMERTSYDHVGLKCCVFNNYSERTEEKVKKGRKALNAASGLGLKPGGLSMKACSLLFWSLIVPIVTFAAELWVLKDQDMEIIDKFQRYAGRRVQRLPPFSPNETSYAPLGWMRLENFIYVKKMLFVRTILVLNEDSLYRVIFVKRTIKFMENITEGVLNRHDSPVFDLLKVALMFELVDDIMHMIAGTRFYEKSVWKNKVWSIAWGIEDQDWRLKISYFKSIKTLHEVSGEVRYSVWWRLSDDHPEKVKQCEDLVRLICGASRLKCDDPRLKNAFRVERMCEACNEYAIEDAKHVILYCPFLNHIRNEMYAMINALPNDSGQYILNNMDNLFYTLVGKRCRGIDDRTYRSFNMITSEYVSRMYRTIVRNRQGIG